MCLQKPKPGCAASKRQYTEQVDKFKHLGLVITSDGRRNKEIDT